MQSICARGLDDSPRPRRTWHQYCNAMSTLLSPPNLNQLAKALMSSQMKPTQSTDEFSLEVTECFTCFFNQDRLLNNMKNLKKQKNKKTCRSNSPLCIHHTPPPYTTLPCPALQCLPLGPSLRAPVPLSTLVAICDSSHIPNGHSMFLTHSDQDPQDEDAFPPRIRPTKTHGIFSRLRCLK